MLVCKKSLDSGEHGLGEEAWIAAHMRALVQLVGLRLCSLPRSYVRIGPRFSNIVLQTLLTCIKKVRLARACDARLSNSA
eukprot:3037481-Pleurochrysis_carterae.AAC.1